VLVALVFLGKTPFPVPFLYVIASGITFAAYGFDKSAATNKRWRTRESTLHVLSVLGGWPGALIAQQMFRHKSRKLEFQVFFWLSVAINCGALGWSASESGATTIRTIFDAAVGSNYTLERARPSRGSQRSPLSARDSFATEVSFATRRT
jgi:uncharacterized membrane protein YsdA (DUF1294 family)